MPRSTDAKQLRARAIRRFGVDLPLSQARSIAASGSRAISTVDDICTIVNACARLGRPISTQQASGKLSAAGGDVQDALYRLTSPSSTSGTVTVPERLVDKRVIEHAVAVTGEPLTQTAVRNLLERFGGDADQACGFLDGFGEVLQVNTEVGSPLTRRGIRIMLHSRSPESVIARLRSDYEKRQARWNKPCELRFVASDRVERRNAMARCGDRRCVERLVLETYPYLVRIVAAYKVPFDDGMAVALGAIDDAIEAFPHDADFTKWYGTYARTRILQLQKETLALEEREGSLDEPVREDTDQTVADRIHDELSVDPALVVMWREQLREAIDAFRASRAARGAEYDAGLVMA